MIRRILAIAGLAVRSSIRSRLVACLLVLLLAVLVALPLTVQSDGTPEGLIRILVGYTMGLASVILSLTALWSGALSIAREIDEKQMQLVCSKPVHRAELWLGKWLGLTAVHVVLLALCAGATGLSLQLHLRSNRWTEQEKEQVKREVLLARRTIAPQPFDLEDLARAELQRRRQQATDHLLTPEQQLQGIRQELLMAAHTVNPGASQRWTFRLPAGLATGKTWRLNVRLSTSRLGGQPAVGTWLAGPPGSEDRFRLAVTNAPGIPYRVHLPGHLSAGASALVVQYLNDDPDPVTVILAPRDGLELQVPAGSFGANFLRAVGILAVRLALLTAIGVTASTLFSTPVASLVALAMVIILQAAGYVSSLATGTQPILWGGEATAAPGLLDLLLRKLYWILHHVLAPLQTGHPLDDAATGTWVPPALLARAAVVQLLVYGGLMALFATAAFNRREVARPSS